jgi:hypothetical protein
MSHTADQSGLNPAYGTNWVWQFDILGEFWDSPFAITAQGTGYSNVFAPWMATISYPLVQSGTIPGGAFWYQTQNGHTPVTTGLHPNCVAGENCQKTYLQAITFTFAKNLTFSDGVAVTPTDFQFSLDALSVANYHKYPLSSSPFTLGSPALLASKIIGQKITLYFSANTVWNLGTVSVPIFPSHEYKYLNMAHFCTAVQCTDPALPYDQLSSYQTAGAPAPSTWVTYEPNMAVGSGDGSGELDRNVNYFRAAWNANVTANTVAPGTGWTYNFQIKQLIFNPSETSTYCGVPAFSSGWCTIEGSNPGQSWAAVGMVVKIYDSSGNLKFTAKLTKNIGTGVYSFTVPGTAANHHDTAHLSAGSYEAVIQTTYVFQGLHRIYYQATGFGVS